jgi:hypothetical protein
VGSVAICGDVDVELVKFGGATCVGEIFELGASGV